MTPVTTLLADKLDSDLLRYIVGHRFQPGDRLPSLEELSRELKISTGKLREQLEAARALELVEVRPHNGIRLAEYSFLPAVRLSLMYALAIDRSLFDAFGQVRSQVEAAFWREAALKGPVAVEVVRPDGRAEKLELAPDRPRLFADTEQTGLYRVKGPGRDALYACAVLDEAESDNRARENLSFAERGVRGESWALAEADRDGARSGREAWKYLAGALLFLLVLEWYVYNRRLWG